MKAVVILLVLALASLSQSAEIGVARILGTTNDSGINGYAWFITLSPNTTWVYVNVAGITQNPNATHGIHIHQFGDITSTDGTSAGEHYVGAGSTTHSCETTYPRHEGDLGNWNASAGAIVQIKVVNLLSLSGNTTVIGKSLSFHLLTDDCTTQPTGASGPRLAYGVIGVANPAYLPNDVLIAAGLNTTTLNTASSLDSTVTKAIAVLTPISGSIVTGTVTFTQAITGVVTVQGVFTGLNASQAYGFHIHSFGDLNSTNGESASSHFNPYNSSHGAPPNPVRHVGDLGNICTYDTTGLAYYSYVFSNDTIPFLTLNNINSIIGRGLIVHSIRDTGLANATFGTRLAQAVIGVANATTTTTVTIPSAVIVSTPTCDAYAANSTIPPTATTAAASTAAASTAAASTSAKISTTAAAATVASATSSTSTTASAPTSAASVLISGASFLLVLLLAVLV